MRTRLAVVSTPSTDDVSGMAHAAKPVLVQAFVVKLTVEALGVSILRGFARLNQAPCHLVLVGPLVKGAAAKLQALVGPDDLGITTELRGSLERRVFLNVSTRPESSHGNQASRALGNRPVASSS